MGGVGAVRVEIGLTMASKSIKRTYEGFTQNSEAVAWEKVEYVFDTLFGQSKHSFSGSHLITAIWVEANGVEYHAEHLDEVKAAYNDGTTDTITFFNSTFPDYYFQYDLAKASVYFQMRSDDQTEIESKIATISNVFPVQEKHNKEKLDKVFIVHGHNSEMKESVARVLEKFGLQPIILHEQPNQGRTIIEKFTDYSNVSFAVILLSPDDLAYPRKGDPDKAKFRARQNVILELGFFLGKLGRQRVLALFRKSENFELPSDYDGVVFTAFDDAGNWRFELARELKVCGFTVDVNVLL